jgi:hypothetical protein
MSDDAAFLIGIVGERSQRLPELVDVDPLGLASRFDGLIYSDEYREPWRSPWFTLFILPRPGS